MEFCDFELEERPQSTTTMVSIATITDTTEPSQQSKSSNLVRKGNAAKNKQTSFQLVLYPELQARPWIQLLGEIMVDLNIFLSGNERYMRDSDMPWNSFRPTLKVEEFRDGSMQSFHENEVKGRLNFHDTIQLLMQQPLSSARIVGEKLAKYQQKIIQAQDLRLLLLEHYTEEDLKVIFTEIQDASIQKAMAILQSMEKEQENNKTKNDIQINSSDTINNGIKTSTPENNQKFYLYIINVVNNTSLLPTPVIVGQNSGLVELMGGGQDAYKQQMVRKGYLNFDSYYSHLQMLLLELGVQKECWLQARTIEGYSVPMHITISHTVLHKLQLAPLTISFNSTLAIYNIDVPQNVLKNIKQYREEHQFEGFQDDLSYMLHCQIFLQKHYHQSYDLSSDRRCNFKATNEPKPISVETTSNQII